MITYSEWSSAFVQGTLLEHQGLIDDDYDFSGDFFGKHYDRGSVTGSYAYNGTGYGGLSIKLGAVTGAYDYAGAGFGGSDSKSGSTTRTYAFHRGPTTGQRSPVGTMTGNYRFSQGLATGKLPGAVALGYYLYDGATAGEHPKSGTVSGTVVWDTNAWAISVPILISYGSVSSTQQSAAMGIRRSTATFTSTSSSAALGIRTSIVRL